jgi:hypothetical protein
MNATNFLNVLSCHVNTTVVSQCPENNWSLLNSGNTLGLRGPAAIKTSEIAGGY